MTTSQSNSRYALAVAALLFAAVLLASGTTARAADGILQHRRLPVNEADEVTSGTDTISGTIITDGTLGPLSLSNILGGELTLQNFTGAWTAPLSSRFCLVNNSANTFTATSTELLLGSSPADDVVLISPLQPSS